jgi:hypothetical protein
MKKDKWRKGGSGLGGGDGIKFYWGKVAEKPEFNKLA